MGFAAGMYAGQKAAESAIDNFRSARKNRDERQVQAEIEGLQTKNAEEIESSTAAGGAYDAEQLRLASMSPQQLKAQQVGLGRTPAGSVPQMSPVANPQFRPDPNQTVGAGLMMQPNSQQSRSPASGQAMGMGARPEQVAAITQSEMLRKREGLLRSRGQTEMADDVAIRASNQEDIDYRQGRDVKEDERNAVLDSQRDQTFKQQLEINGYQLETQREARAVKDAVDSLSKFGSVDEAMASSLYNDLPASQKAAVAGTMTGVANAEMLASQAGIKKQFSKATDIGGVIGIYNDDEALTEGTTIEGVELEDGGYRLDTYQDQGLPPDGDEGPSQTRDNGLTGSMTFPDAETADLYLRQKALDPVTAAMYYQEQKAAMRTVAAEALADASDDQVKALDSLIKMRIEFNSDTGAFFGLPQEEKEEEWGKIVSMYAGILTPKQMEAQMGGLKDARETPAGANWFKNLISSDEGETAEGETAGIPGEKTRGEQISNIGGGLVDAGVGALKTTPLMMGARAALYGGGKVLDAADYLTDKARGLSPGK